MIYELSKRQLKELANGKALQIALPDPGLPDFSDAALIAWAVAQLPGVDPQHVRSAVRESVEVFRQRAPDHPIADEIGTIRHDQTPFAGRLSWWCEVIVVTISERNKPRSTYPVQWPARYEFTEED